MHFHTAMAADDTVPSTGTVEEATLELNALRKRARQEYVARMSSILSAHSETTPLLLSEDEETLMRAYYHRRVSDVCRFFSTPTRGQRPDSGSLFPPSVLPSAHRLLARYLSRESPMAQDGKHVVLAAVLLAAKTAHVHPTGASFAGRVPNTSEDVLLRLETRLLGAVGFDVWPWTGHDALAALVLKREDSMRATLWKSASDVLFRLASTDLFLVLDDCGLAAAALHVASGGGACPVDPAVVRSHLDAAAEMESRVAAEMDAIRAIDARLISLRRLDPEAIVP